MEDRRMGEWKRNADSLGRDFEFCCLCVFFLFFIFPQREFVLLLATFWKLPTRDKSKQKIGFYAHLFSKATEVSKVRLQHFSLGSFLRDADEMRNLWRESIGADRLKLSVFVNLSYSLGFRGTTKAFVHRLTCEAVGLGGRAGGGGSHPLLTPKNPDKTSLSYKPAWLCYFGFNERNATPERSTETNRPYFLTQTFSPFNTGQ